MSMGELLRKGYEREKRCQVAVQQSEESRAVLLLSLMLEFEKCRRNVGLSPEIIDWHRVITWLLRGLPFLV
jgi:hypothetical protein